MKTAALALLCVAALVASFFIGRARESARLAARGEVKPVELFVADRPLPPPAAYPQLSIQQLLSAPLTQFYEALRDAPRDAYEAWSEQLQNLPDDERRTAAARGFYKLLVQFDPAFAATAIERLPANSGLQWTAAITAIRAVPPNGMREIATMLTRLPPETFKDDERDHVGVLLARWGAVDPEGLVQFCEAHPELRAKTDVGAIAHNWAALDPQSAQQWLSRQDATQDQDPTAVLASFVTGMWVYDHETAVSYVRNHLSDVGMIEAAGAVAATCFLESDAEAKEFVESLPAGQARREAIARIAESASFIAEREGEPARVPGNVAKWLLQFPREDWKGAMSKVIGEWGEANPEEVIRWIQQQPDEARLEILAEYRLPILDEHEQRSYREIFQITDKRTRDAFVIALLTHQQESGVIISDEVAKLPFTDGEKEAIAARIPAKAPAAAKQTEL